MAMMETSVRRLVLLSACFVAGSATAQPASVLDARGAQAIVAGCAAHAAARNQSQAIAVVDIGGRLVAALRMDGNGSGAMDFALAKAEAAAAWGFPTTEMAEAVRERVPALPTRRTWSTDGKVRLGAIGVSGGREADDVSCAEAGIRAGGLRSSRS
jgi:glc operon protein GlcG